MAKKVAALTGRPIGITRGPAVAADARFSATASPAFRISDQMKRVSSVGPFDSQECSSSYGYCLSAIPRQAATGAECAPATADVRSRLKRNYSVGAGGLLPNFAS